MQSPLVGVMTTTPGTGKQCLLTPMTILYSLNEDNIRPLLVIAKILSFIFQTWRLSQMSITSFSKEIFICILLFSELIDKMRYFTEKY